MPEVLLALRHAATSLLAVKSGCLCPGLQRWFRGSDDVVTQLIHGRAGWAQVCLNLKPEFIPGHNLPPQEMMGWRLGWAKSTCGPSWEWEPTGDWTYLKEGLCLSAERLGGWRLQRPTAFGSHWIQGNYKLLWTTILKLYGCSFLKCMLPETLHLSRKSAKILLFVTSLAAGSEDGTQPENSLPCELINEHRLFSWCNKSVAFSKP